MSDEQTIIKKENKEKEINISNKENIDINNFANSKDKSISAINIDKDQLFQSFLLFQDFITKNPNIIKDNKIMDNIKKEEIEEMKEILSQSYDNKNKIEDNSKISEEEINKEQNTVETNNNISNIKLYDDIPIKSAGYNFVELLEKSLAKEEIIKQKDKTKNSLDIKKNQNITENSKEKADSKSTNEKTEIPINKMENDNERNITGFLNKEISDIKNNKNESDYENKNKADIIKKEINKINIIKNNENINEENHKEEKEKQDNKINNGKEISFLSNINNENKNSLIDSKIIESNEEMNEIYQLELNELEDKVNDNKENNINIINNQRTFINNNKIKKNNEINAKENYKKENPLLDKNLLFENGSDLNKEKLIQKKIKELNSEIIKFREEKAKIIKLKLEYEKIQTKLMNDVQQFNYKKAEFEKYRNEELNKIKIEKKKLIIENKNINNIKFQNQSFSMIIKKDKETIENLKKQILEYQHLLKQKEKEDKNNNRISVGRKNGIINNNKRLDEMKFDNIKKTKREKRNHSSENIKINKYNKNHENFLYQTDNLINIRNDIEKNTKKISDELDLNELSDQYNNFSDTYFNNINELNKASETNDNFYNYENKVLNLSNDNNEALGINIENKKLNFEQMKKNQINNINDEYKLENSDNDDVILTKKDLTSPERFFTNINNNRINKIKKENQIIHKKNLKNEINAPKNITSKSFGNKKKSKDKIKKLDKKIQKYNTVTRITGLKKTLENNTNPINMKMNNSNNSSTFNKTLNKSYKSSINKIQNKIKSKKEEKNINDNEIFNIPQKYLKKDYILIKTMSSEGKIINIYSNNKLEVIFKSGVKKEIFEDGFQIVNFTNGDLKQIFPDGKIIYTNI